MSFKSACVRCVRIRQGTGGGYYCIRPLHNSPKNFDEVAVPSTPSKSDLKLAQTERRETKNILFTAESVVMKEEEKTSDSVTAKLNVSESATLKEKEVTQSRFGLPISFVVEALSSWFGRESVPPEQPQSEAEPDATTNIPPKVVKKKPLISAAPSTPSRDAIDSRTRALVQKIAISHGAMSQMLRVGELANHIRDFPDSASVALKENIAPRLVRFITYSRDPGLVAKSRECLVLLGHVRPPRGRGIRLLAIDGGGTRGLAALEVLGHLEKNCNKKICELFDYVVGVSTGAIIAGLLAGSKLEIGRCKEIYRTISSRLFNQGRFRGTTGLLLEHSYYDTVSWVAMLRGIFEEKLMSETAADPECPKLGFVSAIVNQPMMQAFVFRNYNLPVDQHSIFPGSSQYKLWEAVQASGAAPGYFQECRLGNFVHQDGGVLVNNPAAIGIHECRLLWPDEPIQCVVSVGNGRSSLSVHQGPKAPEFSSLKEKIVKIVDSATDTELVHTAMSDLLPPATYYRFNPYLSHVFTLDENRPEKLTQLEQDASLYSRKNLPKLQQAAAKLLESKSKRQRFIEWAQKKLLLYWY